MRVEMAKPQENGPRPSRMAQEGRSRFGWIRRWVWDQRDRRAHPGESKAMRRYRRWRDSTGRAPYVLSSVRDVRVGEPWIAQARETSPALRAIDDWGRQVGVEWQSPVAVGRMSLLPEEEASQE